jgi:hypothetical protein
MWGVKDGRMLEALKEGFSRFVVTKFNLGDE